MANVPSPADALALFARSMKLCAKVPAQHDAVREAGALLPLVALLRSSTFGGATAEEARMDALEALCDLTVCSAMNMRAVRDELAEALVPLLGHAPLAPELLCILARSGRRGQELIREAHGVQPLVQLLAQLTDAGAGAGGSASAAAAGAPSSAAAGAVAGAGGPAAAGAPLSSGAGSAFISAAAAAAAADSPPPLMLPTLRQDLSADEAALLPRVLRAVAALAAGDAANQAELREAGAIPLLVVQLDSPVEASPEAAAAAGGGGGSAHQVTTASRSSSSQQLACPIPSVASTFGLPPPPRAALLHAGAHHSAALAAAALAELAAEKDCCDAIYEAEGLRRLVALLSADEASVAAEAAHALRSVAFRSAVDRDTIREKGGIPPLVELLRCGAHTPQAAWAAGALRHLGCADCHGWPALHAGAHHSAHPAWAAGALRHLGVNERVAVDCRG